MNTHWIALNAIDLLRHHHTHEAGAYLRRFDHGSFHRALVAVTHHHIPTAIRDLRHILILTRKEYA